MNNSSTLAPLAAVPSIGGDELAEGLMLVRASALKVIRLQLAMERRDRRVALEAVDDLMALDRRLQGYLADLPAFDDYAVFKDELEAERSALNMEKLTLTAGVSNRGGPGVFAGALNEAAVLPVPAPIERADDETLAEPAVDWWDEHPALVEGNASHSRRWWVLGLLLLIATVATAAFAVGGIDPLRYFATVTGMQ